MSFLKNWFVDRPAEAKAPEPSAPKIAAESAPIPLQAVTSAIVAALADVDPAALDSDVARAKIADVCRDLSLEPADPIELDPALAALDRAAMERLAICALVIERGAVPKDVLRRLFEGRTRSVVREGIFDVAKASSQVTLDLLRESPLRREELARRLILGLGGCVAGESLPDARAALERLDYDRLMAEADRARRAGEARGGPKR